MALIDGVEWVEPCVYCGEPCRIDAPVCTDCYILVLQSSMTGDPTVSAMANLLMVIGTSQGLKGYELDKFALEMRQRQDEIKLKLDAWTLTHRKAWVK